MTEKELTDKWLASIGRRLDKDNATRRKDVVAPLLPFLILDIFDDYFRKSLNPKKFKQKEKKVLNEIKDAYARINRTFYRAFTLDEAADVGDLMDSLKEYVRNDVMIAETAIWNVFKEDYEEPTLSILTAAYMCNELAKDAQTVWWVIYPNESGKRGYNHDIDTMLNGTCKFARALIGRNSSYVDDTKWKKLEDAKDILGRRFIKWMEDGEDS